MSNAEKLKAWREIREQVRECAATLELWQAALHPKPGVNNPFEELFGKGKGNPFAS